MLEILEKRNFLNKNLKINRYEFIRKFISKRCFLSRYFEKMGYLA
jgi:hypothetical protein